MALLEGYITPSSVLLQDPGHTSTSAFILHLMVIMELRLLWIHYTHLPP